MVYGAYWQHENNFVVFRGGGFPHGVDGDGGSAAPSWFNITALVERKAVS